MLITKEEPWIAAPPSAARNDGEEEPWIATLTLAMTYLGAVIANGVKQSGRTLDYHQIEERGCWIATLTLAKTTVYPISSISSSTTYSGTSDMYT